MWTHEWKLTVSDPGRESLFLVNRVYRHGILPRLEALGESALAIPSVAGGWRSCSLQLVCRNAIRSDRLEDTDEGIQAALQGLVADGVVQHRVTRSSRRIPTDTSDWFRYRLRSLVADFSSRHLLVKPLPDLGAEANLVMAACKVLEILLPAAEDQVGLATAYVRSLESPTGMVSDGDSTKPDVSADVAHSLRHLEYCYRMLPRRPPFRRGLLNGLMSPYDLLALEKLQAGLSALRREADGCYGSRRPPWSNGLLISLLHDLFACHRLWRPDSPSEISFARMLRTLLVRRPELQPSSFRAPSFEDYPRWLELCFFLEAEDDDLEVAAEHMRRHGRRSGIATRCWSEHYGAYEQSLMVSVPVGIDMRRARQKIWSWAAAQDWPGGRQPLELRYFNFQPTSFYGGKQVIPLVEEIQSRVGVLSGRLRVARDELKTPGLYLWAAQFAWLLLNACSIPEERALGVLREWQHSPAPLRERRLDEGEYNELAGAADTVVKLIEPHLDRLRQNELLAHCSTMTAELLFDIVRQYADRVDDSVGLSSCVYRSVFHKVMLNSGIRWREEYCILGLARRLGGRLRSYDSSLAVQVTSSAC